MEICRVCWCCESICECGDEAIYEEAAHCENCGSISVTEDLIDGYCEEPDCQEAYEEWRDEMVDVMLTCMPLLLEKE